MTITIKRLTLWIKVALSELRNYGGNDIGLNRKRGRIPNSVKERAKQEVDIYGGMAYHYACYSTGFGKCPDGFDEKEWEAHKQYDFMLIDCILKEIRKRGLWLGYE